MAQQTRAPDETKIQQQIDTPMEQTKDSWHHGKDPWSERDRVIQEYVDRAKRGETIPDKMSLPNGNMIHDFKDVVMKQIRDETGDEETTIDWTKVDEHCPSPPPERVKQTMASPSSPSTGPRSIDEDVR